MIGSYNIYKLVDKALNGSSPNVKGVAGEKLARINQNAKRSFWINNRKRVPDAISGKRLVEVKNVDYISNTLQLRDYADIARKHNLTQVLKVRLTTKVAQSVIDAGWIIKHLW